MSILRGSSWAVAAAVFVVGFAAGCLLGTSWSPGPAAGPAAIVAPEPPAAPPPPSPIGIDTSRVWSLVAKLEDETPFGDFGAFRGIDREIAIACWLGIDAEAAARCAIATRSNETMGEVFGAWARRDPEAALGFADASLATGDTTVPDVVRTFVLNGLGTGGHADHFFDAWVRFGDASRWIDAALDAAFASLWCSGSGRALETFYALAPKQQEQALPHFLKHWGAIDPDSALAWVEENHLDGHARYGRAGSAVLDGLAETDPVRALLVYAETGRGAPYDQESALYRALRRISPAGIEALVGQHPETARGLTSHLAERARELAPDDIAGALAVIDGLKSGQFRDEVAARFSTIYKPDEDTLAPFLAWVAQQGREDLLSGERGADRGAQVFSLGNVSLFDGVLRRLPPGPIREAVGAAQSADAALRAGDQATFIEWYKSVAVGRPSSEVDLFEQAALEIAADWLPGQKLDLAAGLRSDSFYSYLKDWFYRDPDAALAWAAEKDPEGELFDPSRAMAANWAGFAPEAAARWAESLPAERRGDAAAEVAETWAEADPAAALAWAESIAEPESQAAALAGLSETWFRKDETGATTWLASLEPGHLRDRAIAGAVGDRNFSSGEDYLPLRWAAAIGNDQIRLECLRSMTDHLDPDQLVSDDVRAIFSEAGVREHDLAALQVERPVPDFTDFFPPDGPYDPFDPFGTGDPFNDPSDE